MNTQENNKLIAEFMGYTFVNGVYESPKDEFHIDEMLYDTSWNWLMPVVEKIESLGYEFFIVENRVEVAHNTDHSIETIIDFTFHGGKRGATYRGVVEFINQYNKDESID